MYSELDLWNWMFLHDCDLPKLVQDQAKLKDCELVQEQQTTGADTNHKNSLGIHIDLGILNALQYKYCHTILDSLYILRSNGIPTRTRLLLLSVICLLYVSQVPLRYLHTSFSASIDGGMS